MWEEVSKSGKSLGYIPLPQSTKNLIFKYLSENGFKIPPPINKEGLQKSPSKITLVLLLLLFFSFFILNISICVFFFLQ
jgi:hypothetical protein